MKQLNGQQKTTVSRPFLIFGRLIVEIASKVISHDFDPKDKELAQAVWNTTFNLPGPKVVTASPSLNQHEQLVVDLFLCYAEIQHSIDALKDSAIFIRRYEQDPKLKRRGISRSRYVRYHNDKWLSEAYILYGRLEKLLKQLSRRYRTQEQFLAELKEQLQKLKIIFATILKIRGHHVHVSRHSDTAIQSMESIELLSKRINNKVWKNIAEGFFYKQAETGCYRNMVRNNKAIASYLDALFLNVNRNLFLPSGDLVFPMKES
jgi:hypothetical protein